MSAGRNNDRQQIGNVKAAKQSAADQTEQQQVKNSGRAPLTKTRGHVGTIPRLLLDAGIIARGSEDRQQKNPPPSPEYLRTPCRSQRMPWRAGKRQQQVLEAGVRVVCN
jgi:hypothetical protein